MGRLQMNNNYFQEKIKLADDYINSIFKNRGTKIYRAMEYSLTAGGKRIRPLLCMLACEALGGKGEDALPLAAAVEMVHTYSLIHDDLPAMDNDDLRRGVPTNHKVFGEATALLAGDALLTEAFSHIAGAPYSDEIKVKAVLKLATKCGGCGMVYGQVLDMEGVKTFDDLLLMYERKTADLLTAALGLGAIAAGGSGNEFDVYGKALGIAFQIRDDILDVTADEESLGKTCSDRKNKKVTAISFVSFEKAQLMVSNYTKEAIDSIDFIKGRGKNLRELADYLINRQK